MYPNFRYLAYKYFSRNIYLMTNKLQGCRNTSFRENMASLVHDMLKLMEIARHPKRDVPYTAEKNGAEG